jgi:hypothetical protein
MDEAAEIDSTEVGPFSRLILSVTLMQKCRNAGGAFIGFVALLSGSTQAI